MRLLYHLGVLLYALGIRLAALFGHYKAKQWVQGRKHWKARYPAAFEPRAGLLWMHVSSLGEFEQGRPVLEAFRKAHPERQIALTFFSPSGYEIRKNYAGADFIAYLPADTPANARFLLDWLKPSVAIFVKYDLWANYLLGLQARHTPTLLISALFRKDQLFFKWYGGFWRRMLGCFTHLFLQHGSARPPVDPQRFTFAGDTRIDRVLALAREAPENTVVAAFAAGKQVLVAGSTWAPDEERLLQVLRKPEWQDVAVLFAPHDVSEKNVQELVQRIGEPERTVRYSEATPQNAARARWLVIDNIGLLNALYRYGWTAYIGGGFGKSIHNTLEPAAWGLPVLFGPRYQHFTEAVQMVERGGAFPVRNATEMESALTSLRNPAVHQHAQKAVAEFLEENKGATQVILAFLSKF